MIELDTSFNSLLFIPKKAPFDFYTKNYEKGLQLYSNGVLIMDKCDKLLPDYYSFVKGVVDSPDLSLNISREMLQQDKTLNVIAKNIETKIHKELLDMIENDRTKYEEFFKNFGMQIKFGIYNEFGINKDKLKLQITDIFTKIRNILNDREAQLLLEVDKKSNEFLLNKDFIKKADELPKKINNLLIEGKELEKGWNVYKLNKTIKKSIII